MSKDRLFYSLPYAASFLTKYLSDTRIITYRRYHPSLSLDNTTQPRDEPRLYFVSISYLTVHAFLNVGLILLNKLVDLI